MAFFFTEEHPVSFPKDNAIFADSHHLLKQAVLELIQEYSKKSSPAILEIIDACTASEQDFKQFCLDAMSEIIKDNDHGEDEKQRR